MRLRLGYRSHNESGFFMPIAQLSTELLSLLFASDSPKQVRTFFDTELKGFMLEQRPSGGMTFYFRYQDAQKRVRLYRIGKLADITVQQARIKAYEIKALLLQGHDPKREAYRLSGALTLGTFVDAHYVPYVAARKRNVHVDLGMLRRHILPPFGDQPLTRITVGDVYKFQQSLLAREYAHATVNRLLVLLSHIFNVAIRLEQVPPDTNPCKGVAMFKETQRERYLSQGELAALFAELDRNPNILVCQLVRLLLYTGARKRELLDARWDEVDFTQRVLWVPPERSKSKRRRPIALSNEAIEILKALPRADGVPYAFFNPQTAKPPVSVFVAWDSIRKRAGIPDFRMHDLRHSFASFLVNAGRSLYDVQRLLGHHDPKVTMRYAHLSQQTMVEASDAAASTIAALLGPRN